MLNFIKEYVDYKTLLIAVALTIAGLVSIYSATYDVKLTDIPQKQMIWAGLSSLAMILVAVTPLRLLQRISLPMYFGALLVLVAVLLLAKPVSGTRGWFNFGTMRLQPAEFAKITTVLALASFLARSDIDLSRPKDLLIAALLLFAPVVLILKQPDVGTAVIYLGMFLPVLYWGGASRFTLLAVIAPLASALAALFGVTPFLITIFALAVMLFLTREHNIVAAVVFSIMVLVGVSVQSIYNGLKPYQQKRISTFLEPGADPLGAGYNVLQSKVAIGSGGAFGKGFLRGTQTQLNFIPEQWTDFIFCVPGEEFGFAGAAVVLSLLFLLLWRAVKIASTVKNSFGSFVAIGIAAVFGTHITINVGMAVGLLPVIGVPLPFLSYGGSALLTNMIMIGLLLNLYANRKEH